MQIISNIALITINETLLVQVASFLIFLFLMNRIMFRPLRETMAERDAYIQKIQTNLVESEKELQELTDHIKAQEKAVRSEALALSREIEVMGNTQANELFSTARQEVNKQIENARLEVDTQIAAANKSLQKESEILSVRIIENLLDRKVAQ